MRFFVAKGAPQNDGGWEWWTRLWWRFALDYFVAWAASEKRRQAAALQNGLGVDYAANAPRK
jgi:hypothetical protein